MDSVLFTANAEYFDGPTTALDMAIFEVLGEHTDVNRIPCVVTVGLTGHLPTIEFTRGLGAPMLEIIIDNENADIAASMLNDLMTRVEFASEDQYNRLADAILAAINVDEEKQDAVLATWKWLRGHSRVAGGWSY